jgi:hypothetical protein
LDDQERLAACTALALRLWATTALTIPVAELTAEVSGTLTRLTERGYTLDQAAHTVGSGTLLVRTPEEEFTFVHQSVMEWLVANSAAEKLRSGDVAGALLTRTMSVLMRDFLCDLAGYEVARRWAADVLANPAASRWRNRTHWPSANGSVPENTRCWPGSTCAARTSRTGIFRTRTCKARTCGGCGWPEPTWRVRICVTPT